VVEEVDEVEFEFEERGDDIVASSDDLINVQLNVFDDDLLSVVNDFFASELSKIEMQLCLLGLMETRHR
jgi:hypothetical protein